jgi:hypothetical protein
MEELLMKKMTKKVVIATTAGLASMILNAACGYGPPVEEQYVEPSTYGTSATEDASSEASSAEDTNYQDDSSAASTDSSVVISGSESSNGDSGLTYEGTPGDASSILESGDEYLVEPDEEGNYKIPSVPAVYGPPTANE